MTTIGRRFLAIGVYVVGEVVILSSLSAVLDGGTVRFVLRGIVTPLLLGSLAAAVQGRFIEYWPVGVSPVLVAILHAALEPPIFLRGKDWAEIVGVTLLMVGLSLAGAKAWATMSQRVSTE